MPNPITAASLIRCVQRMRSGDHAIRRWVELASIAIPGWARHYHAFLPESDLSARLMMDLETLSQRFPDPNSRPPLYGVLVGVKDIFRVDGFPTRAGSSLPPDLFAGPEAPVVTRLREAGALILGKTVTTEFAYFEPGPTLNPHFPRRTPGGSSSGSAAAVGLGLCPLALGTQTVGSVLRPASYCGVVGFKPTYGLLSTEGVIPYAPSLDHVGFFVALASDLPLALTTLGVAKSVPMGTPRVLAVPEGPYLEAASPEMQDQLSRWITRLKRRGWAIRRVPAFDDFAAIKERNQWLASAEMAQVHQDWYPKYQELYRPRTRAQIEAGQAVTAEQVQVARSGQQQLRQKLEGLLHDAGASAWICPAAPSGPPSGLASTGDPVMNMPWTYAGLPAVSLPLGRTPQRLPLGLQLVAPTGHDAALAALAIDVSNTLEPRTGYCYLYK